MAIVARVPPASTGLLLVIAMHDCGHGYATAGACSAAVATGMALGSPFVGRLIDRRGQTTVLLATAVVAFAAMAAFAVAPRGTPTFASVLLVLAIGGAAPPVPSCARAIWSVTLDKRAFGAAVSLEASLQELAFMLGALIIVAVATACGATAAMLAVGAVLAATTLAFALLPRVTDDGRRHDR